MVGGEGMMKVREAEEGGEERWDTPTPPTLHHQSQPRRRCQWSPHRGTLCLERG